MIFVIDAITAEIIAKKYYKQIYSFCYSSLFCDEDGASEVTQEVFLFFQERCEELENTNIQAWLYKVARNKMGEYIRANKKIPEAVRRTNGIFSNSQRQRNFCSP